MRFVFISRQAGEVWGGSEELWSRTAIRLQSQGHDVMCAVKHWPNRAGQIDKLLAAGVSVVEYTDQFKKKLDRYKSYITGGIRKFPVLKRLIGHVVRFNPDLVCVSHGSAICGIDLMLDCHHRKIPYVSVAQANFEQWWPKDQDVQRIRIAYRNAVQSFFVSRSNLHLFERQIAERIEHAEVVWNPVNVSYDSSIPWPGLTATDTLNLACVGRLDPTVKGQDLICEVLGGERWTSRNVKVFLYGRGAFEAQLGQLSRMFQVQDKVVFKGHVDDVESIWRQCHALLLPSRYEGLPLCLVECMLCARPSIVTGVAGNVEIVQDNISGFIAPSVTREGLDDAMERAWQVRESLQAVGQNAVRRIRELMPEDPIGVFSSKLCSLAEVSCRNRTRRRN